MEATIDEPGTRLANGAILLAERPMDVVEPLVHQHTIVLALAPGERMPFVVWRRRKGMDGGQPVDVTYQGDYFAGNRLDAALVAFKGKVR